MCGICGVVSARGRVDRDLLAAMAATLAHRGPDSEGTFVDGGAGLAARRLAIIDLDSRRPADLERGRHRDRRPERRDLQLPRADARARARGPPVRDALGHRDARPRLRGVGPRVRRAAARHVRRRDLGRDTRGGSCSHATASGSSRSTTASTTCRSRSPRSSTRCRVARSTSTRSRPSSPSTRSRRRSRSSARSASCRPGTSLTWDDGRVELERYARPGPLPARHDADEAELVEECRARLRDSVRAHLVADVPVGVLLSGGVDSGALAALAAEESSEPVRTFSIGFEEASFDELVGRARGGGAIRHASPRARAAARRGAAPAGARRGVRRAVRRLVRAADLPRLEARGRGREGRALGRGRRRALRRLLHLRRRPDGRARRAAGDAGAAGSRTAADVDAPGELRLQGEALRARRAPAAARAAPRLEGDLLGRRPRRAHRSASRVGSGLAAARALRRDRGRTSCSPGSRTSTSASTSPTICW